VTPGPLHVVLGPQRYRVERPWGRFPPGEAVGLVSTLAVSREGHVLVARRSAPAVAVFAAGADGVLYFTEMSPSSLTRLVPVADAGPAHPGSEEHAP